MIETSEDWAIGLEPMEMFDLIEKRPKRKLRLFACSCCHRISSLLVYEPCRTAVDVAERYADGTATQRELEEADRNLLSFIEALPAKEGQSPKELSWAAAAQAAAYTLDQSTEMPVGVSGWAGKAAAYALVAEHPDASVPAQNAREEQERAAQCDLLRDIYMNPFLNPAPRFDRSWRGWEGGRIKHFATEIYEKRNFARLPELAQLLETAGCAEGSLLSHCRNAGPHVRGCWVLDLVLGKQ